MNYAIDSTFDVLTRDPSLRLRPTDHDHAVRFG